MKEQEEARKYCSKCNRCLTDDSGASITAFQVEIKGLDRNPYLREQLGKYAPMGDRVIFRLCYECWLNSLFANSPSFDGFDE